MDRPDRLVRSARLAENTVMRYSVHEDRRKPEAISASNRQPAPQASTRSTHRDFRALGLLLLLAALAIVVVLSVAM